MSLPITVPHPTLEITLTRCGPQDLEPMLDRLETLLHEDYFFRRKHFAAILARPQAAVYAVRVEGDFSAIAIMYDGTDLQNLYVHPEHRRLGVGSAVLRHLNPSLIRAKGNMSQGDPIPFYEQHGYKAVGTAPGKPHVVIMEKPGVKLEVTAESLEKQPPFTRTLASPQPEPIAPTPDRHFLPPREGTGPVCIQAPSEPLPNTDKRAITPEKRAQLDSARARSVAKRLKVKADADYSRLIRAGIDQAKSYRMAYGEGSDLIPPVVEPVLGHSSE